MHKLRSYSTRDYIHLRSLGFALYNILRIVPRYEMLLKHPVIYDCDRPACAVVPSAMYGDIW